MSKQMKGTAMLLLAAMVWGAAFVAQTVGMDHVEPFTFQAFRQMLGALVLLPVIFLRDKAGSDINRPKTKKDYKELIVAGFICGLLLFIACSFQQFGLLYTTPGRSGFITALYVIMVPLSMVFFRKRVSLRVWIAVGLSVVGLYFLCMDGTFQLGKGELLTLVSALCFTIHILYLERIAKRTDGVRLASLQFFFCSLISVPFMLLVEQVDLKAVLDCWLPICYTGLISSGVGFTLQIVAQKDTNPTLASIAMSMESVFAVLFGWILMGIGLMPKEILGCVLMFSAIVLAQLPSKIKKTA